MKYQSIGEETAPRPDPYLIDYHFWLAIGAVEILLFLVVLPLLLVYTIYFHDGFAWNALNTHQTLFNVHPLCMVLGFIIIYSQGAIVYRVLRHLPKTVLKLFHAAAMVSVIFLATIGLVAVFKFHNDKDITNLYSLHSWLGLTTVILFGLQIFGGVTFFLVKFPCIKQFQRDFSLPCHRVVGLMIYVLAALTVLSGLQEKIGFGLDNSKHGCKVWNTTFHNCTKSYPYSDKPPEGIVVNLLGLSIAFSVIGVVAIVTYPYWVRREND